LNGDIDFIVIFDDMKFLKEILHSLQNRVQREVLHWMRLHKSVKVPIIKFKKRESSPSRYEYLTKKSSRRKTLLTPDKQMMQPQNAEEMGDNQILSIPVRNTDVDAMTLISYLLETKGISVYQRKLMILTK